ncbi:CRISPR-associated helicase Cas3' [Gilliamella apicola]|nr:CRISPR-associated helicase Cas3' [Gilliamella apicola]
MNQSFYQYWGKCQQSDTSEKYHLLAYHNLDVAACGYFIVKNNYFNSAELFEQLGFSSNEIEKAALWFAYFLAWHDIGKFANGFQQLFQHNNPKLVAPDPSKGYFSRHDSLGHWLWKEYLIEKSEIQLEQYNNNIKDIYDIWLLIMTGHHGKPPILEAKGKLSFNAHDKQASLDYIKAINQLFIVDAKLTCYPTNFFDKTFRKNLTKLSWLLAAITVISDWLGSNEQFFPFCSKSMELSEYWANYALANAEKAVATLPKRSSITPFKGIKNLFPFIEKPTPLQQQALSCQLTNIGPELFIMEDVTGAGKTEASMILAHRLMAAGKAHGIYIGMPTQATANGIYQRTAKVYGQLYQADSHPSLVLAHGASYMNPNFTQTIINLDNISQQKYLNNDNSASSECNEWFVDTRKKSLLAEVGVGTLDQALMAVMPFKHQSLRLLGLRHKLLILDEVHAYDSYMVKLLESLLHYHASQGGSAIILTATLPFFLREKLLNAFYSGLTSTPSSLTVNTDLPFPLFTQLNQKSLVEHAIATRDEVKRQVKIDWIDNINSGIEKIKKAIEQGKIICWIKNSVADAISLYQQIKQNLHLDTKQILLFHSRFAYCDRLAIEQKTIEWAGKTSNNTIRSAKIIIATQVIEQSLDLDFDEMISDIAPIDLLIQRAGRLQRHVRDKHGNIKSATHQNQPRDERNPPILTVFAPTWQDDPSEDWLDNPEFRNTKYVYANHAYLWFTQRVLRERGVITMPEEARLLIEAVYRHDLEPPEGLQEAFYKALGEQLGQSSQAKSIILNFNKCYSREQFNGEWDKEIEVSTRLSKDNIDLYLAYQQDGKVIPYCSSNEYAWEQSHVTISASKWARVKKAVRQLDEQPLEKLRQQIHRPNAIIVLIEPEKEPSFYSKELGFYLN